MESQSMGRWTLAVMFCRVLIVENMTAKSQLEEGIMMVIASSGYLKLKDLGKSCVTIHSD
jgi:hypothetical protein